MRILMATDSLGMPRPETPPEQIWTHRLATRSWQCGDEAMVIAHRGLTMREAAGRLISEITDARADIVIFQIGIVDCCRRPWPNGVRKLIERGPVRRWVSRNRLALTRAIGRPAVSPTQFAQSLTQILDACRAAGCRVALVEIAPPGAFLVDQIHGVMKDAEQYNDIIERVSANGNAAMLHPFSGMAHDRVTLEKDGHHLTPEGHEAVFKSATAYIESIRSQTL